MARRSRRSAAPDPEDYLPEENEFDEEEEEEEERPRRERRRPRDEEEEERPRRRRPRDDDDDEDEEEEERPRRKRRSRDEEDEEPRRRRRPRDDDEDDDEEEEDEDDEPRRRTSPSRARASKKDRGGKKGKPKSRTSNRSTGWDGYDKLKSQSSSYADKLALTKIRGEVLVKFLDAEPFDFYGLHWFDELSVAKKGWVCLKSVGEEDCPGCDLGDRANPNALFNVLVLDDDGDWNLKVIAAGTRLTGQLQGLSEGKGGLDGPYWSVMAGPKGSGTANFQKVKERDLEDDWEIEPLTDDEIDDWLDDAHVLSDVENIPSFKDFKDAVSELED